MSGQVSQFSCPHCSAILRIRGRASVGREVDCPDCHSPIVIVSDGTRQLTAQKSADSPAPHRVSSAANRRLSAVFVALKSPVGVAWSAASVMTLIVTIAVWPTGSSVDSRTRSEQTENIPSSVQQDRPIQKTDRLNETQPPAKADHSEHQTPKVSKNPRGRRPRTPADTTGDAIVKTSGPARREPVRAPKPQHSPKPKPKPIDVAGRLRQPILRFDQSQPVAVRDLLSLLEEMAGVPIRLDQPIDKDIQRRIDRRISLKLTETTVGGILNAVLDRVGLGFRIETDGIHIGTRETKTPKR